MWVQGRWYQPFPYYMNGSPCSLFFLFFFVPLRGIYLISFSCSEWQRYCTIPLGSKEYAMNILFKLMIYAAMLSLFLSSPIFAIGL